MVGAMFGRNEHKMKGKAEKCFSGLQSTYFFPFYLRCGYSGKCTWTIHATFFDISKRGQVSPWCTYFIHPVKKKHHSPEDSPDVGHHLELRPDRAGTQLGHDLWQIRVVECL